MTDDMHDDETMLPAAAAILDAVAAAGAADGLGLTATCRAGDYDATVPPDFRLPDVGGPDALVIAVGNTRALWPHVLAAAAAGARAPVDEHVAAAIHRAAAAG